MINPLRCFAPLAALAFTLAACAGLDSDPRPLTAADYAPILANSGRTDADMKDDAARRPAQVLDFARIRPGDHILEMEVGRGWYTEILSIAVGPTGHVTTQNPPEFDYSAPAMAGRRAVGHLKNVTDTTSHFDDIQLASASVDKALWILGPHELWYMPKDAHLGDPNKAFAELYRVIKPGGEFIVMDHAANPGSPTTTGGTVHRIDPAIIMGLAIRAGFKFDARNDVLANPQDDRAKRVFDATIRRHTDQFLFRFYKPG